MARKPSPIDNRGGRVWIIAFQSGFKRTSVGLEQNADELLGLLELADLRIVAESTNDADGAPQTTQDD